MKKILSLLMCYVFLQAQSFALKGGPSGNGIQTFAGTYSGVMLPDLADPLNTPAVTSDIGLFIFTVPGVGPAVGSFVIFDFTTGGAFLGVMNGLADPDTGVFVGIFEGTAHLGSSTTVVINATTGVATPAKFTNDVTVAGSIKATASQSKKSFSQQRLNGTGVGSVKGSVPDATFTISTPIDVYIGLTIDGFRQTSSSTTISQPFTVGGTGP